MHARTAGRCLQCRRLFARRDGESFLVPAAAAATKERTLAAVVAGVYYLSCMLCVGVRMQPAPSDCRITRGNTRVRLYFRHHGAARMVVWKISLLRKDGFRLRSSQRHFASRRRHGVEQFVRGCGAVNSSRVKTRRVVPRTRSRVTAAAAAAARVDEAHPRVSLPFRVEFSVLRSASSL